MNRFDKLIHEALSFNQTFKAPDASDKVIRTKELIDEKLAGVEKTKLPDGTWHVHGNLDLSMCKIKSLKDLNVSIVDGYFDCSTNLLVSLEGGPVFVRCSYSCSFNELITLKGCAERINYNFFCPYNKLISLEGGPVFVGGDYKCDHNSKKFTRKLVNSLCRVGGKIHV